MSDGAVKYLLNPYNIWSAGEGVPVIEDFGVDLLVCETGAWPRIGDGCKGAIVNLKGHDRPVVLHGVQHVLYPPAELAAWPDADRRSRFVFITADLEPEFVARLLDDFTTECTTECTTEFTPGATYSAQSLSN